MAQSDFMLSLEMCCDYMQDENAVGSAYVFTRDDQGLHMHQVPSEVLVPEILSQYELVLFDGGNSFGDEWTHIFHPRQQEHSFVQANFEIQGISNITSPAPEASPPLDINEPVRSESAFDKEHVELSGKEDREL